MLYIFSLYGLILSHRKASSPPRFYRVFQCVHLNSSNVFTFNSTMYLEFVLLPAGMYGSNSIVSLKIFAICLT